MIDNIIDQLKRDEGLRLSPYRDTKGHLTIGYGHNIDAHPLKPEDLLHGYCTETQAHTWLLADMVDVNTALADKLQWVWDLDVCRRGVVQNMTFNMGIVKLLGFKQTLKWLQAHDYDGAAMEMKQSAWHHEVGARAVRLEQQMVEGVWV